MSLAGASDTKEIQSRSVLQLESDKYGEAKQKQVERKTPKAAAHDGIGPFDDVNLPGAWFYKLPHKVFLIDALSFVTFRRLI